MTTFLEWTYVDALTPAADEVCFGRMVALLSERGARVIRTIPPPPHEHADGLFRPMTREIWVKPCVTMREELLILAHEGGHLIGHINHRSRPPGFCREREAYGYGWQLLVAVGALVTREEWREDCRMCELWRQPTVEARRAAWAAGMGR